MTAALGRNLILLALLVSTTGAVVGAATALRRSALGWVMDLGSVKQVPRQP